MRQFPVRRFLRPPEAGRYLGLSGRTLEENRSYGILPGATLAWA